MATRKRRAFTKEFKAEAVRLVRESGKSLPTVGAGTRSHGDGAAKLGRARRRLTPAWGARGADDRGAGGTRVSRAGFYAWQTRAPAAHIGADERLGLEIAAIHAESRQRYGSPRIHAELVDRGCRTSRKRVARLMRGRGLAARRCRRFRVTTATRATHSPSRPTSWPGSRVGRTGSGVGHRHHLHSDGRGLALSGG